MKRTALRRSILVLLAAALAGSVAGCASSATVRTDYRPGTNFSAYRTFTLDQGRFGASPFAEERIRRAVVTQLTAKGLAQVERGGDLTVHLHARLRVEKEVEVWNTGGWGYRRGWGGSTYVDVRDVPIGTLVVDLVDAARGELAWRGVAEGTVDPGAAPERAEQRANAAMAKLFKGFPPPS